jgi:hypothetical protein
MVYSVIQGFTLVGALCALPLLRIAKVLKFDWLVVSTGMTAESTIEQVKQSRLTSLRVDAYDKTCQLCSEEFRERHEVRPVNCPDNHFFHSACLKEWISDGENKCPICSVKMFEINNATKISS